MMKSLNRSLSTIALKLNLGMPISGQLRGLQYNNADSDSDSDSLLTSHQHAYNIHIITYIKSLTQR